MPRANRGISSEAPRAYELKELSSAYNTNFDYKNAALRTETSFLR